MELPDSRGLLDQGEVEALILPGTTKNEAGQTLDGLEFNQCVWEHDESTESVLARLDGSRPMGA